MKTDNQDWTKLQTQLTAALTDDRLQQLVREWRVTPNVLRSLGVGWLEKRQAYTFPEWDGNRQICGITCRIAATGEKRMIRGSKRGLYLARGFEKLPGPILLPEGVSDSATLLSRGIAAVGRPSSTAGVAFLAEILRSTDRCLVIVGENDQRADHWPGRDGAIQTAQKLADVLRRPVHWTLPPKQYKDVRDWFSTLARGTKNGHRRKP